ncbi:MAG: hypothetical protein WAS73_08945, partial [Defluviicoccus sp.]
PEPARQQALDRVMAGLHRAIVAWARGQEAAGTGGTIIAHGLAAAPYLARAGDWHALVTILEQVINRDSSPGTLAAALPALRQAAGEAGSLAAKGVLAKALQMAGRGEEAEALLRALIEDCAAAGEFRFASGSAGELFNLLLMSGRAQEALALTERMKGFTARTGLGPWTRLGNDAQRLQALNALGRWDDVLAEAARLRQAMAELPETGTGKESVNPWAVREVILDTGRQAAMMLKRWPECLDLVDAMEASQAARGAPALERARTRFNAYSALLGLRRYAEAGALLDACRRSFEREGDVVGLGTVFSALADLAARRGHHDQAVAHEEAALRYKYTAGDPGAAAVSHFNLANYLTRTGAAPARILAQRLASTLIDLQIQDGTLAQDIAALARNLADFPDPAALPASFAELCARVEAVEGVRFQALFARLPATCGSGDQALALVLQAARQAPT